MADNGEHTPTPEPEQVIKHHENREIAMFLGNLVVESQYHTTGLKLLYERVLALPGPVPKLWIYDVVDEEERHIKRVGEHLAGMRSAFG